MQGAKEIVSLLKKLRTKGSCHFIDTECEAGGGGGGKD